LHRGGRGLEAPVGVLRGACRGAAGTSRPSMEYRGVRSRKFARDQPLLKSLPLFFRPRRQERCGRPSRRASGGTVPSTATRRERACPHARRSSRRAATRPRHARCTTCSSPRPRHVGLGRARHPEARRRHTPVLRDHLQTRRSERRRSAHDARVLTSRPWPLPRDM
jgi:hypothetical protein